jgi:hypothetical protein
MTLKEFVAAVPGFSKLHHSEKILHFGWYLHVHGEKERFDQAAVRACFRSQNMPEPNYSDQFKRLGRSPSESAIAGCWRLPARTRRAHEAG